MSKKDKLIYLLQQIEEGWPLNKIAELYKDKYKSTITIAYISQIRSAIKANAPKAKKVYCLVKKEWI